MGFSDGGKRFDQMPLAFFWNKHADAAKQKLTILHAPMTSRVVSSLRRGQRGNFHSLFHDGNSLRHDSAINQTLRDIFAVGYKPFDRRVPRLRNPALSQWKTNPARQEKRQFLVGADEPCSCQRMRLV